MSRWQLCCKRSISTSSIFESPRSQPSLIRSEEHTSELQSQSNLVCRLLLEKKKQNVKLIHSTHTARVGHPRAPGLQSRLPEYKAPALTPSVSTSILPFSTVISFPVRVLVVY